jgi:hypothetical protein
MVLKNPSAPDAWLLLAMLLVILLNPILDHGDLRRLLLTGLTFVPVVLATIRLAQTKRYVRPAVLLMSVTFFFGVICIFFPNPVLLVIKWGSLAAFFALTVVGLFTYLANAPAITRPHLYTAISVYLLLGMMWFALYAAIDVVSPGAFQHGNNTTADRQSELLYFSLVTLSTVGYGDIIPLQDEARMLAALEGVTGVLYIAITVAILISAFKRTTRAP